MVVARFGTGDAAEIGVCALSCAHTVFNSPQYDDDILRNATAALCCCYEAAKACV